jgi:hypothetical protein
LRYEGFFLGGWGIRGVALFDVGYNKFCPEGAESFAIFI